MNIRNRITGVAAAGAIFAAMATPAFAGTDVTVNGNGFGSHNGVFVEQHNSSTVKQTNVTNISNHVSTSQNTGHNSASFNVGGSDTVKSGNAISNTTIANVGGGNVNADDCGCPEGDVDVEVKNNHAFSKNHVGVRVKNRKFVGQTNVTDFYNGVDTHQNTGWNKAKFNVWGGTHVQSGKAKSTVNVFNHGGGNSN